jgi:hypothetical protein
MGYRVAFRLYSEDGAREVEVRKFRNGKTYIAERERRDGRYEDRHSGDVVGPFAPPEAAEKFTVGTPWFTGGRA